MAEQDEPRQAEPEDPAASPDDRGRHDRALDGTYEYARQHANQKAREADAWAVQGGAPQAGQEPARQAPRPLTLPRAAVSVLRAYRGLLSNGPLVRLLGGEFISSIGDWLYLVALLIVVYETSSDPILLGRRRGGADPALRGPVDPGRDHRRPLRAAARPARHRRRPRRDHARRWPASSRSTGRSGRSSPWPSSRPASRASSARRSARTCRAWSATSASSVRPTAPGRRSTTSPSSSARPSAAC